MAGDKLTIVLVDNNRSFVEGFERYLGEENDLVAAPETLDLGDTLDLISVQRADLVVVDTGLMGENAPPFVSAIRRRFPDLRILAVSMKDNLTHVRSALDAGANGFISKMETGERLQNAILETMNQGSYLSADLAGRLQKRPIG